MNTKINKQT